ncbi:hypothetical protein TWF694_004184 [Orbilia ellipsospora]|uniref:Telomere-associated protein Rif1 N-terminal domain-containing protein n=1 Tax=Orbilia ellipsospora TaxID=2528407 RepID=A0AAV9WXM9_9PEZI
MADLTFSPTDLPTSINTDVAMEDEEPNPTILEKLPPVRPPTPPRDASKTSTAGKDTPPSPGSADEAPASSAESAISTNQNRRVNFSPYINWHQPWKYDSTDARFPPIKQITVSSDGRKPKSILKPFEKSIILITEQMEGIDPSNPLANTSTPFGELLESVVQALASSERTKKSDTYASFANTLRAYDCIPDVKLLADKMNLILDFIKRDFNSTIPDVGTPDTTLIKQACKVLIIFAWWPDTVGLIQDEDANYFLNFAVDILEQGNSKALTGNYLYFLSQQKLPSRLMTKERVLRILQVVNALKDKQKGYSVDLERVNLYARLLVQNKGAMTQNAELWVEHVFQGMLSTMGPLRNRATVLAAEMEKEQLGKEKTVSRAVLKLFPSQKDGDKADTTKRTNFIQKRLEKMLESKDEATWVPQIWGITISLLRGLTIPIDRWENFSPFLSVMSKCFNSSDQALNIYAHIAWAKLIAASNVNIDISMKHFELLLRPIVGYIDDSKASRHTRQSKKAAINNICLLAYYGLRPGASAKQIEFFWNLVVDHLVGGYLLKSDSFLVDGCNILNGLFSGTAKWNENRVSEGTQITPDDIPRLDPKWIRANSFMVFNTLEIAVTSCLKTDHSEIPHLKTWKKMMAAVAEAAKKEIRISAEMMEFVASLLSFLKKLWTKRFAEKKFSPAEDSQFMTHFVILVQLAIQELGTACFTEKWLAEDGAESFSAISTPSGKFSSNSNKIVQHQPVWHLFRLFIDPFKGAKIGDSYAGPVSNILALFVEGQDSRRKKISLLAQGIAILPTHDLSSIHRTAWSILANICDRVVPRKERDTLSAGGFVNGPEIRDVLTILEWGYHHCEPNEFPSWKKLFQTVSETVLNENGIAYLGPALVDPLADVIMQPKVEEDSMNAIRYITALSCSVKYPTASVQYERVYKSLFGDQAKRQTQIPYTSFFVVLGKAFCRTFYLSQTEFGDEETRDILEFLECTREVAESAPKDSVQQMALSLQDGFALWLTHEVTAHTSIITAVEDLLDTVCQSLKRTEQFDSSTLMTLSHLIAAGFESKNKRNILVMLNFWNKTFGVQESLEYPPRVRKVIGKLRRYADFLLPTFPDSIDEEIHEPPAFLGTQVSDLEQHVSSNGTKNISSPLFYRDLQAHGSSASKSSKVSSHPSKPSQAKLRHMDSQIEYQAIYVDENNDPDSMESQLMTDRQKEVRDRQARESELFRDLNSGSPKKDKTARDGQPSVLKLDLRMPNPLSDGLVPASSPATRLVAHIDQPIPMSSSPALPPQPSAGGFAAIIDRAIHFPTSDDLPSSPTSRISKSSFIPQLDDIPSSPPLAPTDKSTNENAIPIIQIEGQQNPDTIDPRSVELSQGSKVRIEEGELPPNLTAVVENIPRCPREAVELQEFKQAMEAELKAKEKIVDEPAEPSQVEDISIHLVSQMDEDDQNTPPVSSTTAKESFSTAPETAQEDDEESESVSSNVPDSPSSRVSSSRLDTPEVIAPNSQRKGHKRKRSKGITAPPPTDDHDEDMADCIVVSQEALELPPTPVAKEDQEVQQPPAKKAKAASGDSPAVATRQQPPRTRRSIFTRSTSDSGVQETIKNKGLAKQQPSKKDKKIIQAGSPSGVQTRSRGRPSAASSLSIPDSQSPRRSRRRRESDASVGSEQDVRLEINVQSSEPEPIKEVVSISKRDHNHNFEVVIMNELKEQTEEQPSVVEQQSSMSLMDKLDSIFEEMRKIDFTSEELTRLDGTAFDIMHWVREQQHKKRAPKP